LRQIEDLDAGKRGGLSSPVLLMPVLGHRFSPH
jgi:hypothetical protein